MNAKTTDTTDTARFSPTKTIAITHLHDGYYQLNETESRAWGAYEADGVEAEDGGEFRRAIKAELQDIADERGREIEVFADGGGLDCQDWVVTVITPDERAEASERAEYDV